jgi:hypothetical protein
MNSDDTAAARVGGDMVLSGGGKLPAYSQFHTEQGICRNPLTGNDEKGISGVKTS